MGNGGKTEESGQAGVAASLAWPSGQSTDRLLGLDALRGVAALVVLAHHILQQVPGMPMGNGALAVDFFLVLSGYVMERTFAGRFASMGPVAFLWKRYKRFWPVMAVGALLGALIDRADLSTFLMMLFLIPSLGTPLLFPLNIPAWSIFFELVCNFLHACRIRIELMLGVSLLAMAAWLLEGGYWIVGIHNYDFLLGIPRMLIGYCIGVLLYRRWRDVPPVQVPIWAGVIGLAGLLVPLPFPAWLSALYVIAICPVILAAGLGSRLPLGKRLGNISFPLYAWHSPIVEALARWLR